MPSQHINYHLLATNVNDVSKFLRIVCTKLFPWRSVWGTRRNAAVFMSNLDNYVRLGRGETVTLEHLCSHLSACNIPWLDHNISDSSSSRVDTKHSELIRRFIYWIYCEVINKLLLSCFYITEGEGLGNETLYYRHSVWNSLIRIGEQQINNNFIQVINCIGVFGVPCSLNLMPALLYRYTPAAQAFLRQLALILSATRCPRPES